MKIALGQFSFAWESWHLKRNKALNNFLKLEISPLKISLSLSSLSRTSYCDVKSISSPTKASIAMGNKARSLTARAFDGFATSRIKFPGVVPGVHKCPAPGTENLNKCPGVTRGRGRAQVDLTDALYGVSKLFAFNGIHIWKEYIMRLELSRCMHTRISYRKKRTICIS